MFQVLTGESWSEAVTRPLLYSQEVVTSVGSGFFFVSFTLVNGIVLMNMVIAVLLENFCDSTPPPQEGVGLEDVAHLSDEILGIRGEVSELKVELDRLVTHVLQRSGKQARVVPPNGDSAPSVRFGSPAPPDRSSGGVAPDSEAALIVSTPHSVANP